MRAFKEQVFRAVTRMFLPALARQMDQDGALRLYEGESASTDVTDYVIVEDRGADTTLFVYSGLDALFAGEPRFEFRSQLARLETAVNLVYFRDLRRMFYHVAPDGSPHGMAFYEEQTRSLMARLGAHCSIAIGSSAGGAAALHYAARCGMDHAVAFSPVLAEGDYLPLGRQLRTWFDVAKLVREPGAYAECVLVLLSVLYTRHRLERVFGHDLWHVDEAYEAAGPTRPRATVYYGTRNLADRAQAARLGRFAEVRTMPVDTGRHNCPAVLKARGVLADCLAEAVREAQAPAVTL